MVASGKKGPGVFPPFEEDGGRLSVILTRAFLLAEGTAITDPSITGQSVGVWVNRRTGVGGAWGG